MAERQVPRFAGEFLKSESRRVSLPMVVRMFFFSRSYAEEDVPCAGGAGLCTVLAKAWP